MLCTPAIIYLAIGAVGFVWSLYQGNIKTMLWPTLFVLIWVFLLNYVCKYSKMMSWILLVSPIIIFLIGMTIFLSTKK